MDDGKSEGDPAALSRLELVSLYINSYYTLDAERRSQFEAAFRQRKLPLPRMPSKPRPTMERPVPMDRATFISYILLIYSGTAIFYSWIFLAERLLKMDFLESPKHKLIQSCIALLYVAVEILVYECFACSD